MLYQIEHKTAYKYHEPISLCHNLARLIPRNTSGQKCVKSSVVINPIPDVVHDFEDFFGNKVVYFAIQREHKELTVTVTSIIQQLVTDSLNSLLAHSANIAWEEARMQLYQPILAYIDARQYVPETTITSYDAAVTSYALASFTNNRPVVEALHHLTTRIFTDFQFKPGFTTIATPVSELMTQKKGVCQDFAHVAIACVRSIGLPARYVSGYIETLPPTGVEKLVGVDASHAWFSVFVPNIGWIDFDPTNNVMPSNQHVTIGWGRDYFDITPLKGVILSSGPHRLSVSVDMKRI